MKRPISRYTCPQCGYRLEFTFIPADGGRGIKCPRCRRKKKGMMDCLRRMVYPAVAGWGKIRGRPSHQVKRK